MFWCRPTNCCQSTSTTSFCSKSDSSLQEGSYLDLGRSDDFCDKKQRQWYRCDKPHPSNLPCSNQNITQKERAAEQTWYRCNKSHASNPPCSENVYSPEEKGSKHHIQIKIIEKSKPRKCGDPKVLQKTASKPCTAGLNDIAGRAVSALSNCISYIFPPKATTGSATQIDDEGIRRSDRRDEKTKDKSPDATQTKKLKDNGEQGEKFGAQSSDGDQEQMDDLIENFKTNALNADDEMFDKLFDKLKNELDRLACECPGKGKRIVAPGEYSKSEENKTSDLIKDSKGPIETREPDTKRDCLTKDDLKNMFAELKELLAKNVCSCNERSNSNISRSPSGVKTGTKCPGDTGGCKCKEISRSKSENDMKITPTNPNEFVEFSKKIMNKLDEIARNCLGTQNPNREIEPLIAPQTISKNYATVDQVVLDENLPEGTMLSNNTESLDNDSSAEQVGKKNEKIRVEAIDNIEETLSRARNGNCIPVEEFISLASELKEALQSSTCKCRRSSSKLRISKKKTSRSSSERTLIETEMLKNKVAELNQDPGVQNVTEQLTPVEDSVIQNLSTTPLLADPHPQELTLLERVANDPMTISDLFRAHPYPDQPEVDSPAESFYSAQSTNNQGTSVQHKREEEVGVNTQCKCFADQVVQTFEDGKFSYGIVCTGGAKGGETARPDVNDVQIRREMSQGGDVEKIKVRIQLKDGKMETGGMVETKESFGVEKSPRFVKNFNDYEIKYETMKTEIEEPKVIKEGNQIKIYIPLESAAKNLKYTEDDNGTEYFSIDTQ